MAKWGQDRKKNPLEQGFQYFSSVPVLHYLQVVLFLLKFEQISWISYTTLCNIRRYQNHFRWVKVYLVPPLIERHAWGKIPDTSHEVWQTLFIFCKMWHTKSPSDCVLAERNLIKSVKKIFEWQFLIKRFG